MPFTSMLGRRCVDVEFTPKLRSKVRNVARKHCSNWSDGRCLPMDKPCVFTLEQKYLPDCDYMVEAVLPNEPAVEVEFMEVYREYNQIDTVVKPTETAKCQRCKKKSFVKTGRNQKHCPDCANIIARQRKNERQRKWRSESSKRA